MARPSNCPGARRRAASISARGLVAGACVVLAATLAGAASTAAPKWLTPRDLSATGVDGVLPDVAVDANGNVILVWAQARSSRWTVEALERPVGGTWSAPGAVSIPADHVGSPQVAASGNRVVAVWERYDGKNLIAQTSTRDPQKGDWSPAESLPPVGRDAISPRVAVDARGDAIIVWASLTRKGWTIQSAYRVAGNTWRPDADLELPLQGTANPDVVIDAAGNAIAVWAALRGGSWIVRSAFRSARIGKWGRVVDVSGGDLSGSIAPRVALERNGDALAVWSRSDNQGTFVERATRKSSGVWSEPRTISTGTDAVAPQVAVNKRGNAVIIWTNSGSTGVTVVATYRRAGGGWDPPVSLSKAAIGPVTPQVALDEQGGAVAVWTHSAGSHSLVQTASRSAGVATWSPPQTLSKRGGDSVTPQVAVDAKGDGALVWSRFNQQNFIVQGAGYDTSGPELDGLAVPAAGVVGARLDFSVAPRDVWSAVGSIRWSFGDGAQAVGRRTAHAYARPGTYTARLVVTDSIGHVSSVRKTVSITAG